MHGLLCLLYSSGRLARKASIVKTPEAIPDARFQKALDKVLNDELCNTCTALPANVIVRSENSKSPHTILCFKCANKGKQ